MLLQLESLVAFFPNIKFMIFPIRFGSSVGWSEQRTVDRPGVETVSISKLKQTDNRKPKLIKIFRSMLVRVLLVLLVLVPSLANISRD